MADIKHHSTLTTGLVSCWDMGESEGVRRDLHGTNHLADNNTVLYAAGKPWHAADLELTNSEYLSITDNASLPLSGSGHDISAFMWVNYESISDAGWNTFIQHYLQTGNNRSWSFYGGSTGTTLDLELSTTGSTTTSTAQVSFTPSTATWYHIGFTYSKSAGEVKFYVNGAQQGATQTGKDTSYFNSTAKLLIGNFYDGSTASGRFDGKIGQTLLFTKVVTLAEVVDLYNSGTGIPYDDARDGIVFDAYTLSPDVSTATNTFAHTVGDGTNKGLVVGVHIQDVGATITGVTYNGVALTEDTAARGSIAGGAGRTLRNYTWYLQNPASGTNNVVITASEPVSNGFYGAVHSYRGVHQTLMRDDGEHAESASATSLTVTPTSTVAGCWAVSVCRSEAGSITDNTNYTGRGTDNSIEGGDSMGSLGVAGSKTVTMGSPGGANSLLSTIVIRPIDAAASETILASSSPSASFSRKILVNSY